MSKANRLKKRVISTAIGCGIFAVLCGSIAFGSNYYLNHVTAQKLTLSREYQGLEVTYRKLVEQHEKAKKSLSLYKKLTEGENGKNFSLDRKSVTQLLDKLNEDYLLSSLNLMINPAIERHGPTFDRKTGTIITSEVNIGFKGITDEFAYSFLDQIVKKFPGYVNLTKFSVARIGDKGKQPAPTDASSPPTFIEASVSFDWLGLQIEDTVTDAPSPGAEQR